MDGTRVMPRYATLNLLIRDPKNCIHRLPE
jgi:hypothetical protein